MNTPSDSQNADLGGSAQQVETQLTDTEVGLVAELDDAASDFVPGANHELSQDSTALQDTDTPSSLTDAELEKLASDIEARAIEQPSAFAKSRGLAIAGRLWAKRTDEAHAFSCLQQAAETSPRLNVVGAQLRRLAHSRDDLTTVEQSLRDTLRATKDPTLGGHLVSRLVGHLLANGEIDEAGKLLDQSARSGDADEAILMQRVIFRLSEELSLEGLEIPPDLRPAVAFTQEVLSGKLDQEALEENNTELAYLRAARLLATHDVESALHVLSLQTLAEVTSENHSPTPSEDTLLELEATLIGATKAGNKRAITLLRQLSVNSPSRRILRALAHRCVESQDFESIELLLNQADPGSGTFSLGERAFLSAMIGKPISLSLEDARTYSADRPSLALALSPFETPALDLETSSDCALRVQIGAGLKLSDFGGGAAGETPILSEPAKLALEELTKRGSASELCIALYALLDLNSANSLSQAQAMRQLSEQMSMNSGLLLAGSIYQGTGEKLQAQQLYEQASRDAGIADFAVAQGLIELGSDDIRQILNEQKEKVHDEALRFVFGLEATLSLQDVEQGEALVRLCQELVDSPSFQNVPLSTSILATAASIAAQRGCESLADEVVARLSTSDSEIGQFFALRRLWQRATKGEPTNDLDELLPHLREDEDPSARALSLWTMKADENLDPAAAASGPLESLLLSTHALAQNDFEKAVSWGRRCTTIDPLIRDLCHALDRMRGNASIESAELVEKAQASDVVEIRRAAYERLADLDLIGGNLSASLMWCRTLAEEFPDHLPSLLRLEETLLEHPDELDNTGVLLGDALPQGDREAYRLVAGAAALARSELRDVESQLGPLLTLSPPPLLALRGMSTVYRDRRDEEALIMCEQALAEKAKRPLDKCTTALSVAFSLSRADKQKEAVVWAQKAANFVPHAFVPRQLLQFLYEPQTQTEKAQLLEQFALSCSSEPHLAELWFLTAQAWSQCGSIREANIGYEKTLRADPAHSEAFHALFAERKREQNEESIVELATARLKYVSHGSTEKLDLELELAHIYLSQSRHQEVLELLTQTLTEHPKNVRARLALANANIALGEYKEAAEGLTSLSQLLELAPESTSEQERASIQRTLGELHANHLGSLEKAMDAYQSALQLVPEDEETSRELVHIYARLGLSGRATTLQTQLIQRADTPDDKRREALALAELYDTLADDPKRASATLERVRKAWPLDADVLEATIQFIDRRGGRGPRDFILDRADKEARRKLATGRIDASLLDTLSRVAALSGNEAIAQAATTARLAYLGQGEQSQAGFGAAVLSDSIDDYISPKGLPSALRKLLKRTGSAMDAAFSVDLAALNATPLHEDKSYEHFQMLAESAALAAPEIFLSPHLGARCLPITTEPARYVVGPDLAHMPDDQRSYSILRAMKLRGLGVGALSRSKEEDRWPMLVALLHLFAPNWRPKSVDARKAAQAQALVEQGLARIGYDDDVPMLALEAIGAIGEQSGEFTDKSRTLANRAAMLGAGNLHAAFKALASVEGEELALTGPTRFRWFESRSDAKDLLLYTTTQACIQARRQLEQTTEGNSSPPRTPDSSAHSDVP